MILTQEQPGGMIQVDLILMYGLLFRLCRWHGFFGGLVGENGHLQPTISRRECRFQVEGLKVKSGWGIPLTFFNLELGIGDHAWIEEGWNHGAGRCRIDCGRAGPYRL